MNTAQNIQSNPGKAAGFELEDLDTSGQMTKRVPFTFDEEGNEVTGVIILSQDSPQHQAEEQAIRVENIQRGAKRNTQIDTKTKEGAEIVATTITNNERRLAMAVTVGWFGFNSEGAPLEYNASVMEKIYTKKPTWLAEVTKALDANKGFTKV